MTTRLLASAALAATAACAAFAPIPPREPAVRGVPRDEPSASLSAVWVGHATVLLRLGHRHVLTDPNLGGSLLIVPRLTPSSLKPTELPPLDAVVISHMHFDHFDPRTLRKLGPRPAVFYPRDGAPYADEIGQPNQRGLDPWEQVRVRDLIITAVPARHSGGRFGLDFLWNHAYTGYVIEGAGHRVFFAGDTGYDPVIFREIGRRFPGIEVAFVPIAPSRSDEGGRDRWGHVGPKQALDIFRDVGARFMVPIHHEAYFSSGLRLSEPRQKLLAEAARRGLTDRIYALRTGERLAFPSSSPDKPLVIAEPAHRSAVASGRSGRGGR